ncbi:hypothetical protein GCM10009753_02850 [Streptantibioticus ferralitis]
MTRPSPFTGEPTGHERLPARHPGMWLPFSVAHPHLPGVLLILGFFAVVTAFVASVSLPSWH